MTAPNRSAAYAALPWPVFRERWAQLPSRAQRDEALRLRFREDQAGFLRYLWPDTYTRPWAPPHVEMLSRPKVPWRDRRGSQTRTYRAIAAPRGISKTGIIRGSIVHDICYGLERVIPILSAGLDLSIASLAAIRAMLMEPKVAQLYGPVSIVGGATRYTVTVGSHRCTLIAKSFGTSVRGLNDEGVRPTRLIVDDGEDKLKVNNPDQRRKWWDFLVADLQKIGDLAGGLIVDWVGTVLHVDSVLARLLANPGWQTSRYQALMAWPERRDLWDACGRVWADLSLGDAEARTAAAREFYEERREEMDRGAVMLHPKWIDLFAFYVAIWTEGIGSVLKELQNSPRDPESSLFDLEKIRRCNVVDGYFLRASRGATIDLRKCDIGIWQDHSGGGATSDFGAIAVVARERAGWAYALEVSMTRRAPSAQHAALWATWDRWRHLPRLKVAWDATGTQGLLDEAMERIREDRRKAGLPWDMPGRGVTLTEGKESIATLEPHLHNGWLELSDALPGEVLDQIRDYPTGLNDDGPDAIHKALLLVSDMPEIGVGYMSTPEPGTW